MFQELGISTTGDSWPDFNSVGHRVQQTSLPSARARFLIDDQPLDALAKAKNRLMTSLHHNARYVP
jgi:hypothetical protein